MGATAVEGLVELAGARVLVVEDDLNMARSVCRHLARAGALTTVATTTAAARTWLDETEAWDLVLLDQQLPDGDGIEILDVVERLAARPAVVAISGFLHEAKRSLRLQACRAILLPKPFHRDDLLVAIADAFVAAGRTPHETLRNSSLPPDTASVLTFGPITVHLVGQVVTVDGAPVEMQPAQFRILVRLMAHPGRALSPAELSGNAQRGSHGDATANVRFQIHSLRRRLGGAGRLIETCEGGYGLGITAGSG